jgi:hypothetical protein
VLVDFFDGDKQNQRRQNTSGHFEFAFSRVDREGKGTLEWVLSKDLVQPGTGSTAAIPGMEGGFRAIVGGSSDVPSRRKKGVQTKRQAVQDYEDRLRAIGMQRRGVEKSEVCKILGRSEKWVQRWWRREPALLDKPKGVEQLDMRGFRELKYWHGYLQNSKASDESPHKLSLYHNVMQSYDWHQAMSSSKRELIGGKMGAIAGGSSYFQRTLRLCMCGREMHKVPDNTRRINDDRAKAMTERDLKMAWTCAMKGPGCCKLDLLTKVEGCVSRPICVCLLTIGEWVGTS